MAFYADQMFYSRSLVPVAANSTALLTNAGATNVGAVYPPVVAGNLQLPTFIRRTAITGVQVSCTVIPAAGLTGEVISFLNGTNTFASAVFNAGTANATAGQLATVTLTTANATFAAGGAPTGTVVCTLTGTGSSYGAFSVWFEQQELYS